MVVVCIPQCKRANTGASALQTKNERIEPPRRYCAPYTRQCKPFFRTNTPQRVKNVHNVFLIRLSKVGHISLFVSQHRLRCIVEVTNIWSTLDSNRRKLNSVKTHRTALKARKKRIETRQVAGQGKRVTCSFLTVKSVLLFMTPAALRDRVWWRRRSFI